MHSLLNQFDRENAANKPDLPPDRTMTDEQATRMAGLFSQLAKEHMGPESPHHIEPTWIGKSPDE